MNNQNKGYEIIRGEGKAYPERAEEVLQKLLRSDKLKTKSFYKEPGAVIDPHYHIENLAAYVLSGKLQIKIGEDLSETIEFSPGDALLMKKGTIHREEMVGDSPVETTTAFVKDYETVQVDVDTQ